MGGHENDERRGEQAMPSLLPGTIAIDLRALLHVLAGRRCAAVSAL